IGTRPLMSNQRLYFAYGRNMHLPTMTERCPAATYVGRGRLYEHRIMINSRGVSTVVPDELRIVHGVLWDLTTACEEALDVVEGLARGHYTKDSAHVELDGAGREHAMIYVAADVAPGPPKPGYLEDLIEAANEHGFPLSYVRHLESLFSPAGRG
ncbi:MAG: gamma-glutamylcyclotransferase family protein, partial [Alphaproteobacteria bacterium]|nr:gamma-glutamylcyclotransferase family protein [Alphaproteobacteria bacterium]